MSLPIPAPTPQIAGKLKVWMAETGGVGGQVKGISADCLKPVGRFLECLRAVTDQAGR